MAVVHNHARGNEKAVSFDFREKKEIEKEENRKTWETASGKTVENSRTNSPSFLRLCCTMSFATYKNCSFLCVVTARKKKEKNKKQKEKRKRKKKKKKKKKTKTK